jgi:hypothetical protein
MEHSDPAQELTKAGNRFMVTFVLGSGCQIAGQGGLRGSRCAGHPPQSAADKVTLAKHVRPLESTPAADEAGDLTHRTKKVTFSNHLHLMDIRNPEKKAV